MSTYRTDDYTNEVVAAADTIRNALGDTAFDVGTNALMMVLAEAGKQSTCTTEEFLGHVVAQVKHLMDVMTITTHRIQ